MLYRLFAKKNHPDLEVYFPQLLQQLSLDPTQYAIKQQVARYQQPYRYVLQGQGLTLSCYENPLKDKAREEKTEVVLACQNTPWLTLLATAPQQGAPQKYRLDVSPLPDKAAWMPWHFESNNQELAEHLLAETAAHLTLFSELEATSFILERQRLYIQWPWLPTTVARQEQVRAAVVFAQALLAALEQVATTTTE